MRRFIYIVCIIICLSALGSFSSFAFHDTDIQVQRLHEKPEAGSNSVFELPIEVRLLGYTKDRNWYKIKVSFNLGLVNFTYIGWAHVPIGSPEAESQ